MRQLFVLAPAVVLAAAALTACGSDVDTPATTTTGGGSPGSGGGTAATGNGASSSGGDGASSSGGAGGDATGGAGNAGGTPDLSMGCAGEPPPGATLAAAPKAYSGGTCPTLPQVTTPDVAIQSSGNDRAFWLVVPADLQPTEQLPVLFLWHWLGGEAENFFEQGEVQAAVDEQRFIAVIPQAKGDLQFQWPFSVASADERLEEEAVFFDDMLSCVSEQFNVNANCVSSSGVSAGALFTAQLVGVRGDWIASFMSLSGGTGGTLIKPFAAPDHKMPGFVLWGGPTDNCFSIMDFEQTSQNLEDDLEAGGHFFLECIHNCGHAVPPFEAPSGSSNFKALWQFALDHPFWLSPGQSPYTTTLPGDLPAWCGIGPGSATPATGACPGEPGC